MSDVAPVPSMQLVAQDYAEVLAALQALIDTRGHERRTRTRMDVQAQVKIIPYKDGQLGHPYTCLTRDLSFHGIGLFQSMQAPCGSQVVVVLPRQEDKPLTVLCTVMYCRAMADGLYNVGLSFDKPFDLTAKPVVKLRAAAPVAPAAPVVTSPPAAAGEDELNRIRQSILG